MKKISLILLTISILFMFCIVVSAEILYSGTCGDNVTYIIDDAYNLTISGDGRMNDYTKTMDDNIPWKNYRINIPTITVANGVSYIGNFSLCGFQNIQKIILPDTISEIGTRAFGWSSLTDIKIPSNVTVLPYGLFMNCTSLQTIYLHKNITKIEENAFNKCTSLKTVYYYGTEEDYDNFINNSGLTNGNEPFIFAEKVFIPEVLPTSISIDTKPLYIIGEDTDLDISVTLNYNDATTTTLSPDEYTLETDFNPNTEGEYNVKVTYGEFTDEVAVKVEPVKMTSISITTPPNKTKFIEGTELVLEGMVITGSYNNGTTEEITDYEVLDYDNSTIGNQTLKISYQELSTTLTITIVDKMAIGIKIVSLPDKLCYYNDETELDLTGLSVVTIYDNDTQSKNTSYSVHGFDGSKAGKQIIRIWDNGLVADFEVEVKHFDYKIDSNISKQYDFDTKTLTVGTNIASRTDSKAVKVLVAVYDSNGVLMGITAKNEFFDTNETKNLSVDVENVEYPFSTVKVFVWDFDLEKMFPMAVGV